MSGEQMDTKPWNSEERFGPNIYICYSSRHRKKWKQWERLGLPKENKVSESLRCPRTDSAAAAAKSLQSCPTLCDLIDGSQPGSPIHGILQARILEWVAISSSRGSSWTRIEPTSLTLAGVFFTTSATWKIPYFYTVVFTCQCHTSDLPLPTSTSPSGNHKFVFCLFVFCI